MTFPRTPSGTSSRRARLKLAERRVEVEGRLVSTLNVQHGKRKTYSHYGCRCPACTEVHRKEMLKAREERRDQRIMVNGYLVHPDAPHGTATGYTYWCCRCPECAQANSERCRYWKAQQRG